MLKGGSNSLFHLIFHIILYLITIILLYNYLSSLIVGDTEVSLYYSLSSLP